MTDNRHDRRARAARERRGDDTMGESYQLGAIPESIRQSAGFKAGEKFAETGELPPGYYQGIEKAAMLIRQWKARQPAPPKLRWLEWDNGRVFIAAGLDAGADHLADSPDARRLLEWLDEATGHRLSLNMTGWALRLAGEIPMPPEVTT